MNPLRSLPAAVAAGTLTLALAATVPFVAANAASAGHAHRTATGGTTTGTSTGTSTGTTVAGPGSYLTMIDHGHRPKEGGFAAASSRLAVVASDGGTRTVHTWRAGTRRNYSLVSWSADGRTALVDETRFPSGDQRALIVDVATGRVHTVDVGEVSSMVLSQDGARVLTTGFGRHGYALATWTAGGRRTALPTTTDSGVLPGPDGTVIAGGAQYGSRSMRVLDGATGAVRERIATPGRECTPLRWWSASRALLSCVTPHGRYATTLALLDPAAGSVRALTPLHPRRSPDLGDLDARRIPDGLYLQASGPCGYTFIARSQHRGRVHPVDVPGAIGNVVMIGTSGRRLVVQHEVSCEGSAPRSELARLDPRTGHEQTIVRLGAHEQFGVVRPYGETDASTV